MKPLPFKPCIKVAFLGTTVVGILNTTVVITSHLAESDSIPFRLALLYEMTGAWGLLPIFPIMYWLFEFHPITVKNRIVVIPSYLLVFLLVGFLHTMFMWGSRHLFFFLFDLGTYNYGIMTYRIPMEYTKQFIVFWLAYALMRSAHYLRDRDTALKKGYLLEQELLRSRLGTLEKQLNPHFLFNTLNAISSTMFEDLNRADQMMASLSDLLRQTLKLGKGDLVTLKQELDFIEKYIALMKLRFAGKLEYQCEVDEALLLKELPFLMIQPLVENSIRHGLEKTGCAIAINLVIERRDGFLSIQIMDNGPGIHMKTFQEGLGMRSTRSRLQHWFGEEATFQVSPRSPHGTCISLTTPLRSL